MGFVIFNKYRFTVILFSSMLQNVFAQPSNCPTNLRNSVAYVNTPTSFRRASGDTAGPVKWIVAPSDVNTEPMTDINPYYDNNVYFSLSTTYAVNINTQLTILKSTPAPQGTIPYATSGLYYIKYKKSGCISAASLTVIESGPYCSYDASDPKNVKLYCRVDYANYVDLGIFPVMTWVTSSGPVFTDNPNPSGRSYTNTGLQSSVSQYNIGSNSPSGYVCRLTFSAPFAKHPGFDPNAPGYIATCSMPNK